MKNRFIFIPLLLIHGCVGDEAVNGQLDHANGITERQTKRIFAESKRFPDQTQISIAIIEKGVARFYGIKRSNDSILISENFRNVFEIGSITKVFTSTLLSDLIIDGKIELDRDIHDYLNFPLKNNVRISFKQLANHTSGLPRMPSNFNWTLADPKNPFKEYDEEKLKEYLIKELIRQQDPGEKHEYSNLGAGLLGYLLCRIDSNNYEDMLQSKIFSKYQMARSTTVRGKIEEHLVKGLDKDGNEVPNWDLSVLVGAGGILSTVEDLSKFAIAQFDTSNRELELTRTKTFGINDKMDVGLGWHMLRRESGDVWHWHNGGTGGYTSSIAIDLAKRNGIVILSNVSAFNKQMVNIDNLCFQLMETLEAN